ncbi:ferredoxin--NADP reductase [Chitinophaga vietnamensis]|uniref:ferredoxin--NADP reductase n=1 Tax=Chitinophaga vietnamensis TaxID=2593957 RepID=UPI001177532E|nr:ferredoxin--NADP reductase [Chitinophaga vietnamensis]
MFLQLRITDIIRETADTYTYRLENTQPAPVSYLPGQFLTFIISLHNKEYRRSYSLSSTPGIDPYLSVTVRKKENGEISRHILQNWKVGDVVTSLEPSGRFTPGKPVSTPRDIFLLAAGSGITPVYAILKHLLHAEPSARITLIYSNTTPERSIFLNEIRALETRYSSQLQVLYLYSNDPDTHHTYRRLSNILLEMLVSDRLLYDKSAAEFFLCGPPDYMRMILLTLTFMGFREDQLHKENFVVNTDVRIARTPLPQDSSLKKVTIQLRNQTYELDIPGNEPILQFALEHAVGLPYSCKGGVCGSCTALCTKGKIWMSVNEVLTEKELAEGLILTCVGYAASDEVHIEL